MMTKSLYGGLEAAAPSQTEPLFFDEYDEIRQHDNRLPHWQQDERTYFVTFHLGDSIPNAKLNDWIAERDAWQKWNPLALSAVQQREYIQRFANTVERWLDAGEGSCVLGQSRVAAIVEEALKHFKGIRCQHHSWVIMPNHVHLLLSLRQGEKLPPLMRSWKGYTSRTINRLLERSGSLWQKDYFDRLIRNSEHFWSCARYIRSNPLKARLSASEYLLYESDFVREGFNWEGRLPSRPIEKDQKSAPKAFGAAPSH